MNFRIGKRLRVADGLIAIFGVGFVAVLGRFVSRSDFDGNDQRYVVYAAVLATLAVITFACLWLPHRAKTGLAVLAVWTVIAALVAELTLTLLFYYREMPDGVSPEEWDRRSKREVVVDLRQKGVKAVPAIGSGKLVALLPASASESDREAARWRNFGGVTQALTVLCNESGVWQAYRSDEFGFNNPPRMWDSGRLQVAFVGDSHTLGHCVPADQGFVAVVRETLPMTLNLGGAGSGPLSELAVLREYLVEQRPRAVVWVFYEGNDAVNLEREKKDPFFTAYLEPGHRQGNRGRQALKDRIMLSHIARELHREGDGSLGWRRLRSRASELVRLGRLRFFLGTLPPSVIDDELFRRILLEARSSVEAWGGTLYFVYLPSASRYGSWGGRGGGLEEIRKKILAAAQDAGLTIIDMHKAFIRTGDPLAYYNFHLSVAGHRALGKSIVEVLSPDG